MRTGTPGETSWRVATAIGDAAIIGIPALMG